MQFVDAAPLVVLAPVDALPFALVPVPFAPFVVFRSLNRRSGFVALLFAAALSVPAAVVAPAVVAPAVVLAPAAPPVPVVALVPVAPLVPAMLVLPGVPVAAVVPMPELDDMEPPLAICIGGHGFIALPVALCDELLPVVVCCAVAVAANAVVSTSATLVTRHRATCC